MAVDEEAKKAAMKSMSGKRSAFHWQPMCQVWLLVCVRMVINMARVAMGPLIVAMTPHFNYSLEVKGQILSAFSAGYTLTQIAGGLAAERWGGAPILTLSLLSAAMAMLLMPMVASLGVSPLWLMLFSAGFLQGPVFAGMQVMISNWTSASLASYASMLAGAGTTAGSVIGLGFAPFLIDTFGWQVASQVVGAMSLLFAAVFAMYAHSRPSDGDDGSSCAGKKTTSEKSNLSLTTAWSSIQILFKLPVLAIFSAHIGTNFVRTFYMSFMPIYFAEVLKTSIALSGTCLVFPELSAVFLGILGARIARTLQDRGLVSPLGCLRLFSAISAVGVALSLVMVSSLTGLVPVTICLCAVQVFASLNNAGYAANYPLVTKRQSGLVSGVGNMFASVGSYYAPIFASSMLADDSLPMIDRWPRLFLAVAGYNALAVALYIPFASAVSLDVSTDKKDS